MLQSNYYLYFTHLSRIITVFITFGILGLGCNQAETDAFNKAIDSFETLREISSSDYQDHLEAIEMAYSQTNDFLKMYPESEYGATVKGNLASIENRKSQILSEKIAYETLVSNQKAILNYKEANDEINKIQQFLSQFTQTIKKKEVESRLTTVSSTRRTLFLKNFDEALGQLHGQMRSEAENIANNAHPLSRVIDIKATVIDGKPQTPIGSTQISNTYQVIMRAFVSQFILVIKVTGEISGDLSSGVETRVVSSNLIMGERLNDQ